MRALLFALGLFGCAAGAPFDAELLGSAPSGPPDVSPTVPAEDTYSLSGLSEAQAAVAREGFRAWCEAVDFCPLEVEADGVYQVLLVDDYASFKRPAGSAAFTRGGRIVRIDGSRAAVMSDLGTFALVVWHEIGHFGIDGHAETGLMSERIYEADPPALEVDAEAVRVWTAQH